MKLVKKLFVALTVLVLTLTASACTVDESELNNLLNELLTSNNSANVTTSNTLPVRPSDSTSNNYGIDSSNPYYPINPTNSSIYLVPPSPPIADVEISNYFSYDFSVYNYYYSKGECSDYPTKLNNHITISKEVSFQTSSGKVYTQENAVFTGGWQLKRKGSLNQYSMLITAPTSGYLSLYVTHATSLSTGACIDLVDYVNNNRVDQSFFETTTNSVEKITFYIKNPSVYAIFDSLNYASINVWGVCFSENPNATITSNPSTSITPPVQILPGNSSIYNPTTSSSQTNSVPAPTYQTTGLYSFEILNSYEAGYVFEENTNFEPFTATQGVKTTISYGKTARDGSVKGYVFTHGLQLGRNGSFDNKSLQLTTTGYQQIEIYATGASAAVLAGELLVVDSQGNTIESTMVLHDTVHSYVLTLPSAGTYALVATLESGINIWGVSFILNNSSQTSDSSVEGSENSGTMTYDQLLDEAIAQYEQMLLNGADQVALEAQLAYIETLKVYAGYYD